MPIRISMLPQRSMSFLFLSAMAPNIREPAASPAINMEIIVVVECVVLPNIRSRSLAQTI